MGLASIIESLNITFNCNCFKNSYNDTKDRLVSEGKKFNIIVLPVQKSFELTDIFPQTNHVETWNTFIVGKNKNYILSNIYDLNIKNIDEILNNQGHNILPDELIDFLNNIWDHTLTGFSMQFFIIIKSITYLCNSFPLQTNIKQNIGAVLFIRQVRNLNATEFSKIS